MTITSGSTLDMPASPAATEPAVARRPVRVAHLIHTMAHGGVETALVNWFRTFDPAKVDAHLICFANPGGSERPFVEAAARAGLPVRTVPWARHKPVWRAARAAAEILRDERIELLHCHNTYANAVGLAAAKMTAVRTLTTVYVWSGYGLRRRILQWVDARLLPRFDQVTAHCATALQATVERGIPADRIRLLTCGFADRVVHMDPASRRAARNAMGVGEDEIVLIKVARFWPEKRHDVLLRAFRHLLERTGHIQLWIPGVGPEEANVRALAAELGVAAQCRFLGFRTDLPELLAMADVQVHTSDEEGVPLAILSGMAAGRPIVSTDAGGITEVLRDGYSGVITPRRDPQAFAAAVQSLLQDPARQQRLGSAARHFVETDYSLGAATARVEQLYTEIARR